MMRAIVNRKMYDTETAKLIGTFRNGLPETDFHNLSEGLYRKRTGEFFLCGEGGPSTKYRERVGDMWAGGDGIIPITDGEARAWAEEHLSVDEYIDIFGMPEE